MEISLQTGSGGKGKKGKGCRQMLGDHLTQGGGCSQEFLQTSVALS